MMSALSELSAHHNQLNGVLPLEIGSMAALTYLDLSNNRLAGSLPSSIGCMASISLLILHDNLLIGSLPASLAFLTGLVNLKAGHNSFTGMHMRAEDQLAGWTGLSVVWCGVVCSSLIHYFIHYSVFVVCACIGMIPTAIGCMSSLQVLDLEYNSFSGEFCSRHHHLCNFYKSMRLCFCAALSL